LALPKFCPSIPAETVSSNRLQAADTDALIHVSEDDWSLVYNEPISAAATQFSAKILGTYVAKGLCSVALCRMLLFDTVSIDPNFGRMVSFETVWHKNHLPYKWTFKLLQYDFG
jgi:hypothetical protein